MEEPVKIPKKRLIELLKYERYVKDNCGSMEECERCGCLNPIRYICYNCEHNNDDGIDPDEVINTDWLEHEEYEPV